MAVIIAVDVNSDGRREVLGMEIGVSEAATFWIEFLRKLTRHRPQRRQAGDLRCPRRHQGCGVPHAQRDLAKVSLHFMRNALAHAGKTQRRVVSGIAPAFTTSLLAPAQRLR